MQTTVLLHRPSDLFSSLEIECEIVNWFCIIFHEPVPLWNQHSLVSPGSWGEELLFETSFCQRDVGLVLITLPTGPFRSVIANPDCFKKIKFSLGGSDHCELANGTMDLQRAQFQRELLWPRLGDFGYPCVSLSVLWLRVTSIVTLPELDMPRRNTGSSRNTSVHLLFGGPPSLTVISHTPQTLSSRNTSVHLLFGGPPSLTVISHTPQALSNLQFYLVCVLISLYTRTIQMQRRSTTMVLIPRLRSCVCKKRGRRFLWSEWLDENVLLASVPTCREPSKNPVINTRFHHCRRLILFTRTTGIKIIWKVLGFHLNCDDIFNGNHDEIEWRNWDGDRRRSSDELQDMSDRVYTSQTSRLHNYFILFSENIISTTNHLKCAYLSGAHSVDRFSGFKQWFLPVQQHGCLHLFTIWFMYQWLCPSRSKSNIHVTPVEPTVSGNNQLHRSWKVGSTWFLTVSCLVEGRTRLGWN